MKKINTVIVGCGRVAHHYLSLFKQKKISNYKIVAVCDENKNKAEKFSKYFNCYYYKDYRILKKKVDFDIAFILTDSGSHYKITKFFLNHNTHVLCEKPLSITPQKSKELLQLSKSKKKILEVVFQNRLNPSVLNLKKNVEKKKFGKISFIKVNLIWCRFQDYYNDGWHGTWSNDGGVINQQAIHHIDVMRWIGGEIESVCSMMGNRMNNLEAEDTTLALIKFKNGIMGSLIATTAARPIDYEASIGLYGERGTAIVSGVALNNTISWDLNINKKKRNKILKDYSEKVKNGYGNSHIRVLDNLYKNLISKKKIEFTNAYESFKTTNLIHALYESYEKKKWIKVNSKNKSKFLGNKN